MNANLPPEPESRDFEYSCEMLPQVDFDMAELTGLPAKNSEVGFTVVQTPLENLEFDCSEAVQAGPPAVLVLRVQLAEEADFLECTPALAELVGGLSEYDQALGGQGLVLDPSNTQTEGNELTLLLRPLDIRWSYDRFHKIAELFGGPVASSVTENIGKKQANGSIESIGNLATQRSPCLENKTIAESWLRTWLAQQSHVAEVRASILQRQ